MHKRGRFLLLLILLLLPIVARAEGTCGSIRLIMRCKGEPVSGGTVTMYDVTEFGHTVKPETLSKILESAGMNGVTAKIGSDGTVNFQQIENGYYLLIQEKASTGYLPMKPFYLSIPITIGETVQYHIEAFPKIQPEPEKELPQTGQRNWPVWVLLFSGLAVTSLGTLLLKQK